MIKTRQPRFSSCAAYVGREEWSKCVDSWVFQPERSRKSFGRVIVQRRKSAAQDLEQWVPDWEGDKGEDWMRLANSTKGTAHVGALSAVSIRGAGDWRVFTAPALNSFLV